MPPRSLEMALPRTYRCQQPINVGTCNAAVPRWGFNDFTGRCQAFSFTGCSGNSNSFANERDCVENCGDICLLPIIRGPGQSSLSRWGYNFLAGRCQEFFFGGTLGNRNNFVTRAQCEQTCLPNAFPECPVIDITLISIGPFGVGCINNAIQEPCPAAGCIEGFACCENGCGSMCVQLDNVVVPTCSQPIATGSCTDQIPRFAFDEALGTCQLFLYTGCSGNDNNFATFTECLATCVPDVCSQSLEHGPCSQNMLRWGYEPATQTCIVFEYGGCGGNGNNFASPDLCAATCLRGLPQVDVCQQAVDVGVCTDNILRYAYNTEVGFCISFMYGGCGGNENNYATLLECDGRCPPGVAQSVCELPIDSGPCGALIQRWAFDSALGRCVTFNYGGCEGNLNIFPDLTTCELRCLNQGITCPDGNPPCQGDPCGTATCPANPNAICTVNLCDPTRECLPMWRDAAGNAVTCLVILGTCEQPIIAGPCTQEMFRWAFNPFNNQCEGFLFGGCLGNDNNFASYVTCAQRCIGAMTVDVCAQPVLAGPCTDSITRWAYNPTTDSCSQFTYSGCGGNGNSFATFVECLGNCIVNPSNLCIQPILPGPCTSQITRFALDNVANQCVPFTFGGCQGNGNNFVTLSDCTRTCSAFIPVCNQPMEAGPCGGSVPAWAFNTDSGQCQLFIQSFCPPFDNSFEFFDLCAQQCGAPVERCNIPILPGSCNDNVNRWGYNSISRQCEQFVYTGCNGNANSFATQAECEANCNVIPTAVNPCEMAIDAGPCNGNEPRFGYSPVAENCVGFTFGGCEGNANNFVSITDCLQRCTTEVCSQPITNCPGTETRWAYDPNAGACISHTYGGCQPSGNFFLSQTECSLRCEAPICSQAMVAGPCSAILAKFVYNALTGLCEPFIYSGCGGTANLFDTLADCMRYCTDSTCLQPIDAGPCSLNLARFALNSDMGACEPFSYGGCLGSGNRFNTLAECQATCEVIPTAVNPCEMPIDAGPCNGNEARFGYSPVAENCVGFTFGGCQGNANNFVSITDCLQRCTTDVCSQPITNCPGTETRWAYDVNAGGCISHTYGGCQPSGNFFLSQTECSLRCEAPICSQAMVAGTCSAILTKFVYNALTGLCDPFIYSGCGGTANLFDTLADCMRYCTDSMCLQPIDAGPCSLNLARFAFNSDMGACEPFSYGGCLGSGNRFNTLAECQATCEAVTGDACALPLDAGPCTDNVVRFFYNSATESCQQFTFGGCGGNVNNFATLDECDRRCVVDACAQTIVSCPGAETRWGYDPSIQACIEFSYGGCTPNANLFTTQLQCQQRCEAAICSQAITTGVCTSAIQKFAYNALTGSCQVFEYTGCGGSANRFDTLAECQQLCENNVCDRPQDAGPCSATFVRFSFDSITGACQQFNYGGCLGGANRFDTMVQCEATCIGAVDPDVCSQPIDAGPCTQNIVRVAFNSLTETCDVFTFGGCNGNGNNFASLAACTDRCITDVCAQPIVNCPGASTRWGYDQALQACIEFSYDACIPTGNFFSTQFECQQRCEMPICRQAISTGTCTSSIQRFGYNSVSGQCVAFTYTGCGGTANRFDTLTLCQQFCETNICEQPQLAGPCSASIVSFSYNTLTGVCDQFIYGGCLGGANRFSTSEICLAACDVTQLAGDTCSMDIDVGPCTDFQPRFAFNPFLGTCQQFTYGGCGGNNNNFVSEAACNQRCITDVCAQPITNCPGAETRFGFDVAQGRCVSFSYDNCVASGNLFETMLECQLQCDTPVCAQPMMVGTCTAQLQRFGYNAQTGQCQLFTYSGCGGNSNRFNSITECEQFCEVDICAQTHDSGPCGLFQPRFRFNPSTALCESFLYSGCLGSANIFQSMELCQTRCNVDLCTLPMAIGSCSFFLSVWRYNDVTSQCQRFTYSGCLGNPNRFATQAECEARCQVSVCSQPQDTGPCSASLPSFSYNSDLNSCEQFSFGGCLGGGNRFDLLSVCQAVCVVDTVGDVCSQPLDVGSCNENLNRFAYNPSTGACQVFTFGGCGGNFNNFQTAADCNQRCVVDVCAQPITDCAGAETRFGYSPTAGDCIAFSYNGCQASGNLFQTIQECRQRCMTPICSQALSVGTCTGQLQRFAYNENLGQCVSLLYSGCGGTANRFNTLNECQQTCQVDICAQAQDGGPCGLSQLRFRYNPVTAGCETFQYSGCLGSENVFATFNDCENRCSVNTCSLPLDPGACSLSIAAWGYNTLTNVCQEFVYTGCLGNPNRFGSQAECQARCEANVCSQPEDVGPCAASQPRFIFNSATSSCDQFFYGGCLGGGNNFQSLTECQVECGVTPPEGDPCSLAVSVGPCTDTITRFAYDPLTETCNSFIFGGCGGNSNNFATADACSQRCIRDVCAQPLPTCPGAETVFGFDVNVGDCVSLSYDNCQDSGNVFLTEAECRARCTAPVCSQAIRIGTCAGTLQRFGFNPATGDCQSFSYSGCAGTANRFNSLTECRQNCRDDVCTQPQASGPCGVFTNRVRFNPLIGVCQTFLYGGCLGNANSFGNSAECQARCNADVCSLPRDPGRCSLSMAVWGYNTATSSCQQFIYTGCLGNPNRFASQAECQARCEAIICDQPEDTGPCSANLQRFSFNSVDMSCQSFSYGGCLGGGNSFSTLAQCQGTCETPIIGDACSQTMDVGPCSDTVTRFAYNQVLGICTTFTYGGCGGNTNNFATAAECNQRCLVDVCAQSFSVCSGSDTAFGYNPTLGTCVQFQTLNDCGITGNIFTTEAECQQRCVVPTCSQTIEAGTCGGNMARFAFNTVTGQCEAFTYTGCGGNANMFTTLLGCQQTCEIDICARPSSTGPCTSVLTRFSYDPNTLSCTSLNYGGCHGTQNRFDSELACQERCINTDVCAFPMDAGSCGTPTSVWGYRSDMGVCQQFTYNGCEGNPNRFTSQAECENRCVVDTCVQPEDAGPCTGTLSRVRFDSTTLQCVAYNYGGCFGSANSFSSLAQCQDRCNTILCQLPQDSGLCTTTTQPWYFNSLTNECQQFEYTGCLGNPNRFDNRALCEARCGVATCSQPRDPGPCRAFTTVFGFNPVDGLCQTFSYGGCIGGANRYSTREICQDNCVELPPSCPIPTMDSPFCGIAFCTGDSQCQPGQLCCPNGCPTGTLCSEAIFVAVKAGTCPSPPSVDPIQCNRLCELDAQCPGDTKCCYTGCGTSCMTPE
ncbi:uncharacterized protein [Apostichopus japonicus]|uniref:uncharacterized protein isoform X2 n=1 Tax=Stichopus japonicus TaxID=307972 RepID=UPI003AB35FFB